MPATIAVGSASVDITPPLSIPHLGFAPRQGRFSGVADRLYARAFVFAGEDGRRVALLCTDSIGFGNGILGPGRHFTDEVRALVAQGVREAFLVSENSTSYGKDLRDPDALPRLLRALAEIDGLEWIRVSYLQPAEVRPGLLEAMCATDKVVPYFDLSFQHAATPVLRRMRRYGSPEQFLGLLDRIRALAPHAGVRSNVVVGFPGETDADVQTLIDFVSEARLDALGVFPYSDEEGTEGAGLAGHVDPDTIAERCERVATLASDLTDARAGGRIGERVRVLVEGREGDAAVGRAAHQGPEVDGTTQLADPAGRYRIGDLVWGRVASSVGADLIAEGGLA